MTSRDTTSAANRTSLIGKPHGMQAGRHDILREFESLFCTVRSLSVAEPNRPLLVGITSVSRGAGVSTVAVNLARAAATYSESQIALVDANSGHAALHETLSTPMEPGLNDFLAGVELLGDCLHETPFERLLVMPCGSPTQRAHQVSVVELVEALENSFAFVVVDLPSIGSLDDRIALARNLDAVLLVLPEDRTQVLNARSAVKQLEKLGINIKGTILNAVRQPANSQNAATLENL